jgi:hypothetical protein
MSTTTEPTPRVYLIERTEAEWKEVEMRRSRAIVNAFDLTLDDDVRHKERLLAFALHDLLVTAGRG